MTLIDGYILRRFVSSYLGCLVSLLLLYVVLDVFTKLDEFTAAPDESTAVKAVAKEGGPAPAKPPKVRVGVDGFVRNLGSFYAYRLPVIYDLINGLIVLLAATFTLGWLEKQNELLPLLAAGVKLRRIFVPAWAMALCFIGLGVLNREALIPTFAQEIMKKAEDPQGTKPMLIQGGFDERGVHIDGKAAYADRQLIMQGRVTFPAEGRGGLLHVACQEMYYRPATASGPAGWRLHGTKPETSDADLPRLERLGDGHWFLPSDLSFERLTRRPNWFLYQSTASLVQLVEQEDQCPRRTEVITTLHARITRPLTELLVVLIGVPLLVGCPQRSLYIKVGSILGLFALAQVLDFASAGLARAEYVDPSFAAWLPILIFGPWSLAASDATMT